MTFITLLLLLTQVSAHDLDGSVYCSEDGEARRLSDSGAVTPIWAPDGRYIFYVLHTADGSLFHLITPAGELLQTIPLPQPLTATGGLSWHPNGEITFAASQGESFEIYNLDPEGHAKLIVPDGILPAWSPDGEALAFTTNRDGNPEIYLVDHEGRLRNLTNHDDFDAHASWSPDGTRIAFESGRFGYLNICVVNVVSGEIIRLTDYSGKDWNPAWGPNGREIAFSSDRDGENLIYRKT